MGAWELRCKMKKCVSTSHQSIVTYDEAHKAMEFVFAKISLSEKPSVDNLKTIFQEIKHKYGELIECTKLLLMSRTGYEVWLVQNYEEGPTKSLWFRQVFKWMSLQIGLKLAHKFENLEKGTVLRKL